MSNLKSDIYLKFQPYSEGMERLTRSSPRHAKAEKGPKDVHVWMVLFIS
jgi:hypothetical protein